MTEKVKMFRWFALMMLMGVGVVVDIQRRPKQNLPRTLSAIDHQPSIGKSANEKDVLSVQTTGSEQKQPSIIVIPPEGPRTPVALCAIQKDAEAYLDEWINYNLAVGFSKIFLYDNSVSFDLERWAERRQNNEAVEVIWLPLQNSDDPQLTAYRHCLQNLKDNYASYEFVAFFDLDEFLVLKKHKNIEDLVREHCPVDDCTALLINWRMFTSNQESAYSPLPLTKRFQVRQQKTEPRVKSIARIHNSTNFKNVHVLVGPNTNWYDTIGPLRGMENLFPKGMHYYSNPRRPSDVAVLNHMFTKSNKEWRSRCTRGRAVKKTKNHPVNRRGCEDLPTFDETVFDNSAWRFLKSRVPAYEWYDKFDWIYGWNETS